MKRRARTIVERHKILQRYKQPWLTTFELIGEYVMTRKQHFQSEGVPGEIQTDQLYDNTASRANHIMSSALLGALWPNTAKSVKIRPPRQLQDIESTEIKDYFEFVTAQMVYAMDHPKAGLTLSLEEYMNDQGAFGISGIGAFEGEGLEVPVIYQAFDAKVVTVDEGRNRFIDTVYITKEYSLRQAVMEYGVENLAKPHRDAFMNGDSERKVKVLHAIEPRIEKDPVKYGNRNMPIASIHIDLENEKILRESGFEEMPVFITRFWKVMGEKYGRSPAMAALPDIVEANMLREAIAIATEKNLDPPLAVMGDGVLGNGIVDTSPGGLNVYSVSGRMAQSKIKPIEPIYTVGELQSAYQRVSELREEISNHFFLDRLMDFNNKTRMTFGEAQMRNQLRNESLGTLYSRQISELFSPLIERTFNILFRAGMLGVARGSQKALEMEMAGIEPVYIPDQVVAVMRAGGDAYDIEFISPASRILQNEELGGIMQTLEVAGVCIGLDPHSIFNLNVDEAIRSTARLSGSPPEIINELEVVKKLKAAAQEQNAQMAQMQAARENSETTRNMAQAASMVNEAA